MKKSSLKTATHKFIENKKVTWKEIKTPFGPEIKISFSNDETTTMSHKRFNELFDITN